MAETSSSGVPLPFMGSGVKQDLHTLLGKFLEMNSIRIRDFAAVFREMRFETILHYRINPAEHVEFTEYLLQNASFYFGKVNQLKTVRSLEERIFGIYVCYAIYSLQPVDHVVQIPVTALQYEELLDFQVELATRKLLEPIAALKSLLLKKAFKISIFQSSYDPATHKRYLAEEELLDFKTEAVTPFARAKLIETNQTMGEMMLIHNSYLAGKKRLGLTDIKLVDAINPLEVTQQHIRHHEMSVEVKPEVTVAQTAGDSRSELRLKAYAAKMKHTRNRRYLDPNMEENFGIMPTFGEIAQECLLEPSSSSTSAPSGSGSLKKPKTKRRRPAAKLEEGLTDEQIAEQVLQNEYASRVKPEIADTEEQAMFGLKRQGLGGVARITAPSKKKAKIVQVEGKSKDQKNTVISSLLDEKPFKKGRKIKTEPSRVSNEWANRLSSFNGAVDAADKKMKKLQSQIKIEPVEPEPS